MGFSSVHSAVSLKPPLTIPHINRSCMGVPLITEFPNQAKQQSQEGKLLGLESSPPLSAVALDGGLNSSKPQASTGQVRPHFGAYM